MVRNTSSSRPDSRCSSLSCEPLARGQLRDRRQDRGARARQRREARVALAHLDFGHRRQRRHRGARRGQLLRLLELQRHGVVVARARREPGGVSSATMRPRAMMMARVHTASTSSRMCVEMTMILSRAISLISVRTSCFWFGIEAVGGLIEDQHRRIVHDRLRQADAAPEALRQGLDGLLEHRARAAGAR